MNVNIESCLTFTFLLFVIVVGVTSGQEIQCNTSTRPHIRGICGQRLARAHANLCLMLRTQFPDIFQRKRSADSRVLDIYSIPMSTLYSVDLTGDYPLRDTGDYPLHDYEKKSVPEMLQRDNTETSPFANSPIQLSDIKTLRDLFLMLKYKSKNFRAKRQAQETNILCECCYNECTVRQLATYC